MQAVVTLYQTSIGKKVVMAVSGVILFGYTVMHMVGNLKVFGGAAYMNEYAIWLREMFGPVFGHEQALWLVRLVLLAALVAHVMAAYQVSRQDLRGRPVGYAVRRDQASTYAGRTMRWGGIVLAIFIVLHLLHLTTGTIHPQFGGHSQAYGNVVNAFRNPLVGIVYLLMMVVLALHLAHGIWSVGQTLGWRNHANDRFWRWTAIVAAIVVAGGFALVPLAVMLSIVR